MKSPYVSELQPNQVVTATLLVQHKDVRQKKTGEPCLSLILGDRTGEVEARMWDNVAEVMDTFERDDFVRVRGLLQVYHNRLQLTVHKLWRQGQDQVDPADFFPASERPSEEMWAELISTVENIANPHLRSLVSAILTEPDMAKRFKIAPAAKNVHHAFLGGLLEHVLSMAKVARMLGEHYRDVDMDLLLTGVLLHDCGKVHELTYDRSFGYSSEGQLLGHIHIGLRLIGEAAGRIPNFPPRLRSLVEHMILSHHGELAYGSPKTPMFPEALLLHLIDNLDSKMECMRAFLHRDRQVEGPWTGYNSALERPFLKKQKYLDEPEPAPATPVGRAAAASSPAHSQPAPPQSPNPSADAPQPAPHATSSPFGEKLMSALKRDNV